MIVFVPAFDQGRNLQRLVLSDPLTVLFGDPEASSLGVFTSFLAWSESREDTACLLLVVEAPGFWNRWKGAVILAFTACAFLF